MYLQLCLYCFHYIRIVRHSGELIIILLFSNIPSPFGSLAPQKALLFINIATRPNDRILSIPNSIRRIRWHYV